MEYMEEQNESTGEQGVSSSWSGLPFILGVAIFLASIFIAFSVTSNIDSNNRANLLQRVQTVAYLTNADAVAGLSGTPADLTDPAYLGVKDSLYKLHSINGDTRFVYYMRSNGDKLFFLADSEQPDSKDYSPPGEVYNDTSPLEFSNYNNHIAFTEGPYTDAWGTWVSGYAPLYTKDGTHVGIAAMDIDAHSWQSELRSVGIAIVVSGFVLGVLFILIGLYLRRSFVAVRISEKMNRYLAHEKSHSDSLVSRAGIGEWTLTPDTGAMSFNDAMYDLMQIKKGIPANLGMVKDLMEPESKKEYEAMYDATTRKTAPELSFRATLLSGKHIHISAHIHYGSGLAPVRVSGIAQEVK